MNPYFVKIDKQEGIWVRHQFMVDAGIPSDTLNKIKYRNKKAQKYSWVIDNPLDKRENIYSFDDMSDRYQTKVKEHLLELTEKKAGKGKGCEDPYAYMALEPIREQIKKDLEAEAFFMKYEYQLNGEPAGLTPEQIEASTMKVSVLNLLSYYRKNKRKCRKVFGLDWMEWVAQVIKVNMADGYGLPKTYRNLVVRLLNEYEPDNYEVCLPPRLGNQTAAKVCSDNESQDMMLELLNHPNQYDDAYIRKAYNEWAKKNGLKTVTTATVRNKRVQFKHLLTAGREGWQEHNRIYSRSVIRMKPSQPLYCIEGDDNQIDWWFQGPGNKIEGLYSYWVVDSFGGVEYPLGWAFSEHEVTIVQVRMAFLMAMMHIKELTGGYYLPHETKTDNWGTKQLIPFYESIGHFAKAAHGSKNRGWLENFYGHIDWKRSLKLRPDGYPANNYTGNNISSKNKGFNQEYLSQVFRGHQLPVIEDAGKWISAHAERLRTLPIGFEEGAKSRQEMWLEAWNALPDEGKRPISEEQFFMKFGLLHDKNGGNQITKSGVQPTIAGREYTYSVPAAYYLPNVGRKVQTLYNPFDMSRVMLTDGGRLHFMANHITPVAGCFRDMQEGGRTFLNQILAEKKADVEKVVVAQKRRKNKLLETGNSVDAVLGSAADIVKLGPAVSKELKGAAALEWKMEQVAPDSEVDSNPTTSTEALLTEKQPNVKPLKHDKEDIGDYALNAM